MCVEDCIKAAKSYTFSNCCTNSAVPFSRHFSGSSVMSVVPFFPFNSYLELAITSPRHQRLQPCVNICMVFAP